MEFTGKSVAYAVAATSSRILGPKATGSWVGDDYPVMKTVFLVSFRCAITLRFDSNWRIGRTDNGDIGKASDVEGCNPNPGIS